ncbi:hypothetical protein VTJ83DRAFT_1238 [Remersonia thermophila]|uniref:DUF4484 domain-containing protein n=1 Tax=Remersonia thermophila TaxID=72144 RepID=A0ABR4DNI9_9PEZI
MASVRRGQLPLSVQLPTAPAPSAAPLLLPDLPSISALFLIDFDVKAGYTIVWKRAVDGLELEGTVEYKSLPSGLHTVPEDLIYFVHDGAHAGLSAFVNIPTDEEATRHARMIAVGVLVPLSFGRLGRAWRHAKNLKAMASSLAADRDQTQLLEKYWDDHGVTETTAPQPLKDLPLESPLLSARPIRPTLGRQGHARNRSASDGAALVPPGHHLSPFHPAWSLTALLDTFGPLIFPVHRAALLRKRILISCHAPVHEVCNFVYDISVLSNIPLSVCDIIDPSAPVQRLRPLFCIGIHDISSLQEYQAASKRRAAAGDDDDEDGTTSRDDAGAGWVACTTDSILAMKDGLWDMLITMPPPHAANAKERVWPTVECPKGVPVKATQRDLRRFRSLVQGLSRFAPAASSCRPGADSHDSAASDSPARASATGAGTRLSKASGSRPGTAASNATSALISTSATTIDTDTIVEPTTWAALAYNGFMWWASAGEKRHSDEVEEQSRDNTLLSDLVNPVSPAMSGGPGTSPDLSRRKASFSEAAAAGGASLVNSLASLRAVAESSSARAASWGQEEEGAGDDDTADDDANSDEVQARIELAVVAYFHRLTTLFMTVLADIVDSSDDDDLLDLPGLGLDAGDAPAGREGDEERTRLLSPSRAEDEDTAAGGEGAGGSEEGSSLPWVRVDSDALAEMGLDVWSQADADFVQEVAARYFARRAHVETKGVEVCGVRVC